MERSGIRVFVSAFRRIPLRFIRAGYTGFVLQRILKGATMMDRQLDTWLKAS
ncbi:MAG: hypothetical protein NTX45_10835 [Proteobacteria bacterium]|nr:hypothetical protein [Pseudomonadota bacterium]